MRRFLTNCQYDIEIFAIIQYFRQLGFSDVEILVARPPGTFPPTAALNRAIGLVVCKTRQSNTNLLRLDTTPSCPNGQCPVLLSVASDFTSSSNCVRCC